MPCWVSNPVDRCEANGNVESTVQCRIKAKAANPKTVADATKSEQILWVNNGAEPCEEGPLIAATRASKALQMLGNGKGMEQTWNGGSDGGQKVPKPHT